MKRIVCLGMGQGGLWLALAGQELPAGAQLIKKEQARFWLRQSVPPMAHPNILHALSEIADALGHPFHGAGALSFDDLTDVLDRLEDAIKAGRLVGFHAASKEGGGKGPQKGDDPKPPEETKSWIKVKFVDDLALQPLASVTSTLTLTDGQNRDFTTRNDGLIEVNGIPPGTCDAAGNIKGAKLPTTLTFMGTGESAGGQKTPEDEPIAAGSYVVAKIESYKVKKGDTLDSIAGKNGMSGQDLAIFNFGTSDPAAVNICIRARVGSKTLGPDKKTYVFDDADKPGLIYIPKDWKEAGLATEKTHTMRLRPVVPRWLAILKVDDHFAPSKETLDIQYSIGGLSKKKVFVEITSDHYKDGPIFKRELTAEEAKDGTHTLLWDGKANCSAGDLKDRYINPLYGPYKVHLYVDKTYTDEAEFKVLYHSIKLQKGPWTPDEKEPPEASEKDWVQYKLNELGYWGGPVGKDTEDYLKKAIIRYKANHKKFHQLDHTKYNDSINADLKKALKAGENKRKDFLEEGAFTDKAKESKVKVEALTYETSGEFSSAKPPYEEQRLNRPIIPMEVVVYLKNKADAETLAPEGVGPVRVNWRFVDKDEDLSGQHDGTAAGEPSKTKDYIEKCLKLKSGRAGNGDNCHKDFKGIRDDAKDWVTPWFMGEQYIPYKVEEDAGQKVVFSKGCIDKAKYEKRVGKAGIYLRTSYISGDDYKVKAEIDFTGLPNQADLEKFHDVKDEKTRIQTEGGTFRVVRFNKIAMVVDWPARSNAYEWGKIADEFNRAFVEVDTGDIATKKISDVISDREYRKIVEDNTTHSDGWIPFVHDIKLEPDSVVGVKLPAQGSTNEATYKTALRTFSYDDYWKKIVYPLRDQLSKNIRKDYPIGFVIVNFHTHKAVSVKKNPPADNTVTDASYITWSSSYGLADSIIVADQKDPDKVYYVVAHEMGHNFWLHHFENAGGSRPAEHDTADHNCIMSYSSSGSGHAHQAPGTFTPHFCGKCNLKLRGWDVDGGALPASS